jgi:hypothetical protein
VWHTCKAISREFKSSRVQERNAGGEGSVEERDQLAEGPSASSPRDIVEVRRTAVLLGEDVEGSHRHLGCHMRIVL